jgi:bloom syndrome protein
MALTATANMQARLDVRGSLGIQDSEVFTQSFNRPNLTYEVRPKKAKSTVADIIAFIMTQPLNASGIIYCSSRDGCEKLAKQLRDNKIEAFHYHAGMAKGDRVRVQMEWQAHKFPIIVATIAFGMGIDKPDVRYVIHHALPMSLEGYYQETGRAGRDGKPSTCVLFYAYNDSKKGMQMIDRDDNLDYQQKQINKDRLREVLRFCMNKTDCRRVQVLSFLGEQFDPVDCRLTCDVCASRQKEPLEMRDVTVTAKKAIELFQSLDRNEKLTLKMAIQCLRGGRQEKDLTSNPFFGSVTDKEMSLGDLERLLEHLSIERALSEFYVGNNAGYVTAYVKVRGVV